MNDIISEISLLYELSLSIGSSLEFKKAAEGFVKILLSRKNYQHAAIYTSNGSVDPYASDHYSIQYEYPIKIKTHVEQLKSNYTLIHHLQKERFINVDLKENQYPEVCKETKGDYAIFKLSDIGFMVIYSQKESRFSSIELNKLSSVIEKFGVSLKACLLYELSKKQIERIDSVSKFPKQNPNPVFRISKQGNILFFNDASKPLLDELAINEKNLFDTPLKEIVDRVLQEQKVLDLEVNAKGTDYALSFTPIKEYGYVNIYGKDITSIKQATATIDKQKVFYENILNSLPTDVVAFDHQHRYTFINPVAVKNQEIRQWLIGKTDFDYVKEKNKPIKIAEQRREKFNNAKNTQKQYEWEEKVINQKGEIEYHIRRLSPVFDLKGHLQMVIGYGIDVTKLKATELELLKAKNIAEESMHSKEIFLANMSHEIRTPMNAILGMSKLLEDDPLSEKQKKYLNTIQQSGENLLVIINDILDFSKIESGKMTFESASFNINTLANTLIDSLQYKVSEKDVALYAQIDASLKDFNIIGDPTRLNQILINLLSNAIKFTKKGNIILSIVPLRETHNNVTLQFKVSDSGIGIEKEKLDHIFKSFSQAEDGTTRKYGGTGLGLTITKQLTTLQGGKIWVESTLNKGSDFYVELEFQKEEIPLSLDLKSPQKNKTQEALLINKRILLVEDNKINQFYASSILEKYKLKIDIADNGQIALEMAQKNTYDLILMDMQMPVMDGLTASKKIRQDLKLDWPILALTANAIRGDDQKCLDAGMSDYLSKPFEEKDLINKIITLLNL